MKNTYDELIFFKSVDSPNKNVSIYCYTNFAKDDCICLSWSDNIPVKYQAVPRPALHIGFSNHKKGYCRWVCMYADGETLLYSMGLIFQEAGFTPQ